MWNKIKFLLGFKVVLPCFKGWIVTKRSFFLRKCLDKNGGYWWASETEWSGRCVFTTKEEAEYALKCFI